MSSRIASTPGITQDLSEHGYSLRVSREIQVSKSLQECMQLFFNTWNNLRDDDYLKEGAKFRKRRYGEFLMLCEQEKLVPLPHRGYYQDEFFNSYAGGVSRVFAPIEDATKENIFLKELIKFDFSLINDVTLDPPEGWLIGLHQMRIVSSKSEIGLPTPEGIHSDGHDFNIVHLINRTNTLGGLSRIYNLQKKILANCALKYPLDSLFIRDTHVLHEVTPIYPENRMESAVRDVLTINFERLESVQQFMSNF